MFNDLLKELRNRSGITQGQLAKEIGVSPGNVGDWETGKSKPGYLALASLARFFEVSADYLLELTYTANSSNVQLHNDSDRQLAQNIAMKNASMIVRESSENSSVLSCDGIPLTESEKDLIAMYRLLENGDQKTVFDITKLKYEQMTGEKVSIYSTYSDTKDRQKTDQEKSSNSSEGIA